MRKGKSKPKPFLRCQSEKTVYFEILKIKTAISGEKKKKKKQKEKRKENQTPPTSPE